MHPYISVSGNSASLTASLRRDHESTCLHGIIALAEKLSLWSMKMCVEGQFQQVWHKQAWSVCNEENRQPTGQQHLALHVTVLHSGVLALTAMSAFRTKGNATHCSYHHRNSHLKKYVAESKTFRQSSAHCQLILSLSCRASKEPSTFQGLKLCRRLCSLLIRTSHSTSESRQAFKIKIKHKHTWSHGAGGGGHSCSSRAPGTCAWLEKKAMWCWWDHDVIAIATEQLYWQWWRQYRSNTKNESRFLQLDSQARKVRYYGTLGMKVMPELIAWDNDATKGVLSMHTRRGTFITARKKWN